MIMRDERCNTFENCCPAKISEEVNVSVPASIRAFANVGEVCINCVGAPMITRNISNAPGSPCAVSNCTISQRLCVDIPITFCAQADVGEEQIYFTSFTEDNCELPPYTDCI